MLKKLSAVLIILSVALLCGCAKNENDIKNVANQNLNNIGQIEINPIHGDDESQNYWGTVTHNFAKGEGGYYYLLDSGRYLMFFDDNTQESYPLCGIPDCSHNTMDCNAFVGKNILGIKDDKSLYYILDTVYYYRGYVYLLSNEGNLVRFSPDGSERKNIASVSVNRRGTGMNLVFYGDYVYVYNMNDHLAKQEEYVENITRYSLDGKEKKVVVEYTGTGSAISDAKRYGNQLFFIIPGVTKEKKNEKFLLNYEYTGLYVYQLDTGAAGKVTDEPVTGYCIDEKNNLLIYFVKNVGLYRYDIKTKEKQLILAADEKNQMLTLSFDGKYIYTENSMWSYMSGLAGMEVPKQSLVIDTEGRIINTINCDGMLKMYFGDNQYMFSSYKTPATKGMVYGYIKKSEIETATGWTELPDK